MFITCVRRNFFNRTDWQWVKQGGGLVSHRHVPAGFFNAGEKAWFWLGVTLLGILMSITGLVLDFVGFGQTRWVLQVANYLHVAGATRDIAAAMGHIYNGTYGTPGAYPAMREGTVDENWAAAHHARWLEQVKNDTATDPANTDGVVTYAEANGVLPFDGAQIPTNPKAPAVGDGVAQVADINKWMKTAITIDWDSINANRPAWNARWNKTIEK